MTRTTAVTLNIAASIPGKHGLVTRVRDWPFSSFHRDVAAGLFPQDWAGELETLGEFGEARVAQ